jgi:hypothetical protein
MNKLYVSSIIAACLVLSANAQAQQWRLSFNARCTVTNNAGNFSVRPVTDQTLIRQCLQDSGISPVNARQYALVYSLGADMNGDLIQVVNATNGVVVCTPFRVLFQEGFSNRRGNVTERLGFLYKGAGGDAIGSVVLRTVSARGSGGGTRTVISGQMQYLDDVYQAGRLGVCTGRFHTTQLITPASP